jgi:hypothetical protein
MMVVAPDADGDLALRDLCHAAREDNVDPDEFATPQIADIIAAASAIENRGGEITVDTVLRELDSHRPGGPITEAALRGLATRAAEKMKDDRLHFPTALLRYAASTPPAGPAVPSDRYRARLLREILDDPTILIPPQALVGRMVFPSRVTLLAAREKAGKSTFAAALAAAYTSGRAFLDGDTAVAGDVLWIGLEECEADLVQRLVPFGVDVDRFRLAGPAETTGMADIEHESGRPGVGLIVIDSLSKVAEREGIDEGGNSQKWSALMSRIQQLARISGAGVLLIHHMNKDGGYRDSTSIGAGVDIIAEMDDGPPDDSTLRRFRCKGRVNVAPFSVRYDATGPAYVIAGSEMAPDARVLAHVASRPGQSMSALADLIGGRRDKALLLVRGLLSRGALVNRGTERQAEIFVAGPFDAKPQPRIEAVPEGSAFTSSGTAREPLTSTQGNRVDASGTGAEPPQSRTGTDGGSASGTLAPAVGNRRPGVVSFAEAGV